MDFFTPVSTPAAHSTASPRRQPSSQSSNGPHAGRAPGRTTRLLKACGLAAALLLAPLAEAAGLLKPANSALPELQIREHQVNVVIEDSYATTSVEQVFHNPHSQALEAIYSFPVPHQAAVGEFTYWIDGKPVTGEVVEKKQAREIYTQEKQAGRETALVEKDEYKTFDISVSAVPASGDVRIRLVYVQPAHLDSGVGRYLYPLEEGGVDEQKLAFWTRNEAVSERFSFNLTLRSSYPIDSLRLPQHPQALIQQHSPEEWQVSLSSGAPVAEEGGQVATAGPVATLDQDILLYWRHAQGLPGSLDLVAYKAAPDKQGTFMLTLTPGEDLAPITQGSDWVFVLDVSGSMRGKYAALVEGVRQGLDKLRADDRFRIVLFNNQAEDFSGGFHAASADNVKRVLERLDRLQPSNGTNLYAGLKLGIDSLDADRSAAVILVTDGVANVGVTAKKRFLELLEQRDLRLFTFVMGNSANRPLLDEMARVSNGFALAVSNADDIVGKIMLATGKMTHQALRDIEIRIDGGRVRDLTPERPGSLYRGQQLVVMGHYRKAEAVEVTLRGKVDGKLRSYQTRIQLPEAAPQNGTQLNPELERLWAYATIENLQQRIDYLGEDADAKQAIIDIATEYGLVTDYTSMLVVREDRFQQHNITRSNQQRVQIEQAARAQRSQQPVRNHRADSQQPIFTGNRPSMGAGAVDPLWLLLLATALAAQLGLQRRREH